MTTTDQGITCKHGLPHGHPCSQCGAEAISSRTFPQHKDLLDAGYAPGGYAFKCMDCGCEAVGDKRARRCQSCAEKRLLSGVSSIPSKERTRRGHIMVLREILHHGTVETDAWEAAIRYAIHKLELQSPDETTAHLPGDGTRRAAFNAWWQEMWKDNDPRSSPGFDEQMRSWSLDAWQAGAAHERDRVAAMRSAEKASGEPTDAEKRAMGVDLDSRDHEAR